MGSPKLAEDIASRRGAALQSGCVLHQTSKRTGLSSDRPLVYGIRRVNGIFFPLRLLPRPPPICAATFLLRGKSIRPTASSRDDYKADVPLPSDHERPMSPPRVVGRGHLPTARGRKQEHALCNISPPPDVDDCCFRLVSSCHDLKTNEWPIVSRIESSTVAPQDMIPKVAKLTQTVNCSRLTTNTPSR